MPPNVIGKLAAARNIQLENRADPPLSLTDLLGDLMTFALVVLLHDGQLGFDKHCVMLFSSEADAMEFAVARLNHYGEVLRENDVIFSADRQERFESNEAALDAYQEGLGTSEYFHVFPVA